MMEGGPVRNKKIVDHENMLVLSSPFANTKDGDKCIICKISRGTDKLLAKINDA